MTFNIYWVDAGEYRYIEEYIDEFARYETGKSCAYVVAKTRAQAKSNHIKAERSDRFGNHDLLYTDKMSIKLVKKDFETEADAWKWLDDEYERELVELGENQDA